MLGRLHDSGDPLAVHGDVDRLRRVRVVVVPDVVVHQLEVPNAFAGFHVERDQACSVEVVSKAIAAVVVVGRRVGRYEDQAAL